MKTPVDDYKLAPYVPPKAPLPGDRPNEKPQKLGVEDATIRKAENGWLVDVNGMGKDNQYTLRKPYVFETAEKLADFIRERF